MSTKMVFVMLISFFTLAGCAASVAMWTSNPGQVYVENPYFKVFIAPQMDAGGRFVMFRIEVTNITDEILNIDWNESRYLLKGKAVDRLVLAGADPKKVKEGNLPLEKILPQETITRNVGPFHFASITSRRHESDQMEPSHVTFGPLPVGYNGVQLVVRADDKAVVEDLQVRLSNN